MITRYGMEWPDGISDLDIELWCYRHDERPEGTGGRLTRFQHFKNAVDMELNVEGSSRRIIWNEWTDDMLKAFIEYKFTGLAGAGSCVSGETRILDPITGQSPTIQSLCDSNTRPWVMTLNGPVQAGIPYCKGEEEMLEFRLSDGSSFKCTAGHRILTILGWQLARDCVAGSSLFGYAPFHQGSNSGNGPPDPQPNARHCFETPEGSMGHYSVCFHPDDAPLQLAKEIALGPVPSLSGVQKYSGSASVLVDGPCNESGRIRPCRSGDPSRHNDAHPQDKQETPWSRLFDAKISSPLRSWFQRCVQSPIANIRLRTFAKRLQRSFRRLNRDCVSVLPVGSVSLVDARLHPPILSSVQAGQPPSGCCHAPEKGEQSDLVFPDDVSSACLGSLALRVSLVQVVSIQSLGIQEFYDIDVPEEHHYFAEGSIHHNSGKSDAAALFAIFDWMSAPTETMFLVCSTTLAGARGRIWKSISEIWGALEAKWTAEGKTLPGKMVASEGRIKGMNINGKLDESIGVWLIAAGKDDQAEADKKLKGLKAPTGGVLRLIADEFSDLGMCVFTAMVGNLSSTPGFKGIGMANPGSKNTPFGRFVKPRSGWNSLSLGMTRWVTDYGVCLSFDAYYSPRILTPELEVWPEPREIDGVMVQEAPKHRLYDWMASALYIEQAKTAFGEDSLEFWAQIRGMFCPTGMENTVWSEIELLMAEKKVEPEEWDKDTPVMMGRFGMPQKPRAAALDPAFTTGGDRSPIMWAEFGKVKGVKTMNIIGLRIASEVPAESDDGTPISEEDQITVSENVINQFKQLCEDNSIPPQRAGVDATGGGTVFLQWLRTKWSGLVKGIRFGEAPIERRADSHEPELVYANRVTQLWVQPKALVRMGQIRGVPHEVVEEMCLRRWHAKKNTGAKTCVEEKKDMKKRTGKSPDCFIAGTKVLTPYGEIAIELLRPGDVVITPFGPSPIFAIHESKTDALTHITTTHGHSLTGKGAHKIFTHDQGWVRMDTLSFTNELESDKTLDLWKFLRLFSSPVTPLGFKALVDTIKATPKTSRRDFFTASCGPTIMGRFRKAWMFITSIMSGMIRALSTSKSNHQPSMPATTCFSDSKIQNTEPATPPFSPMPGIWPWLGMVPKQVWPGTPKMARDPGIAVSQCQSRVRSVGKTTPVSTPANTRSAPLRAPTDAPSLTGLLKIVSVSCAALASKLTSIARPKLAVVSVLPISPPEPVSVFNLTLLEHNAYYANGLLVANCGDTFCILVDVAIQEGLLDVVEIRIDDKKINQGWQRVVATRLHQGLQTVAKSVVAMPSTKRLKRA